jgi:hypothetical protein
MIYINEEMNILPKKDLLKRFNVSSNNTIYSVLNKKSYQDYW